MASDLVIRIKGDKADRVVAAYCYLHEYEELVQQGPDAGKPNPMTREQFAYEQIVNRIITDVERAEVSAAQREAETKQRRDVRLAFGLRQKDAQDEAEEAALKQEK